MPVGAAVVVVVVVWVTAAADVVVAALGVRLAGETVDLFASNGIDAGVELTVGTEVDCEDLAAAGDDVVVVECLAL